jgi:hypothetical protein
LREYRAAEAEIYGNNVVPPWLNADCGLNLLAALLAGRVEPTLLSCHPVCDPVCDPV